MIEGLGRDLRHAWRTIRRMPLLAAVVVVSIGAGIGVNTAVFSWIQAVVLQPLPGVRDGGGFFFVEPRTDGGSHPGASWLEYRDLRARVRGFRDLLAYRMVALNIGPDDRTERTYGLLVSDNYFSALGIRPALGRFPRPEEVAQPGGAPVVVISHDVWQARYAGAADVLGRAVRVNGRELAIIGVTPPRFQGTVLALAFDLWMPATMAPALFAGSRELEDRNQRGYAVMGHLDSHTTTPAAQASAASAMRDLAALYPESNAAMQADVLPFWSAPRGPQQMFARALAILQGVMLLLLAAVCGNTANLLLARASTRQREIGLRLALGASRWRVVRLLLTESLILALLGALLGVAIAMWGSQALRAVPMIGAFPIRFQTGVDGMTLGFAISLGIACGLLFGIAPALQLAGVDAQAALRSGATTAPRGALRSALMGAEVALAVVVLVAAALFFKSFRETQQSDPGFRRDGILLAAYDLTGRSADTTTSRAFAMRLLDALHATPGVEAAAIASSVPLDIHGLPVRPFSLEGHSRNDAAPDRALSNVVTPDYFRAMGIPIRSGRDFASLADRAMPPEAVVNDEFVRRYVPAANPIGRRIESRGRQYAIVGVVGTSIYDSFGEPATPIIYYSYRDRPSAQGEIHVRTRPGRELALGPDVRRIVRGIDRALPIYDVRTMSEHIEKNLFLRRIPARMFVVLGPLLLVLAAIGIYAVVAYSVARRTTEIGVRLALGATEGRVVAQIVRESMRAIGWGVALGWVLAVLIALHAAGGVLNLTIFTGVPAILLVVALVACWLPARRATMVDPVVALRNE